MTKKDIGYRIDSLSFSAFQALGNRSWYDPVSRRAHSPDGTSRRVSAEELIEYRGMGFWSPCDGVADVYSALYLKDRELHDPPSPRVRLSGIAA